MLRKKRIRDILKNKSQFITIFLMITIGIMCYCGIKSYMDGMQYTGDTFYEENNLQDINVLGSNFSTDDIDKIKKINNVNDAERKLELQVTNADDDNKSFLLTVLESNNISRFYVSDGKKFSNISGVWVDKFYAEKNNLKVGDEISFKYDNYTWHERINGIVYVPDHIYTLKDSSQLMPDYDNYGSIFISYIELEDYIKTLAIDKLSKIYNKDITETEFSKLNSNFNYIDEIPYNYVIVDVNQKENVNDVKDDIEKNITNAVAQVNIEDTASYTMFQGEIDEAKSFVGIFSGLFLGIAFLSVITTMTRVVKKQKTQIGTLKALGFSKFKITMHYVGYGFWISVLGAIAGILLGRYFLGAVYIGLETSFFEIPNGIPLVKLSTFIVSIIAIILTSLITFLTCYKELKKTPAESLRQELPNIKSGSLNITTKGIFKKLKFSTKWNIRDILRNKFRTITGIIGIVGCCTLIVCALGMLNTMDAFKKLQFEDLYNFDYKLSLKDNLNSEEINDLTTIYGDNTSETLSIEIKDEDGNRDANQIFVDNSNGYMKFVNDNNKFIKLTNDEGIYVTYKLAETNNYKIGDEITWHIYGDKTYYTSKIVGFYKDPQVQGCTVTSKYLESLNVDYKPDTIYTNEDLNDIKTIKNVDVVQSRSYLKEAISSMLSMMRTMIIMIIFFAVLLGIIIIYNMGILSYTEKTYQFSTLKVLGFDNKKIRKIFIMQNNWLCIISIIIGLPLGYYLIDYLMKACMDANFDFATVVYPWTYIVAAIGTFLVSYTVSYRLSKKIETVDMVASLKANE